MQPPAVCVARDINLRPLQIQDLAALKHLHDLIFPIDYDQSFFSKAVSPDGEIVGWAAVTRQPQLSEGLPDDYTVFSGGDQLIGFITARVFPAKDLAVADRQLLDLADQKYDCAKALYILTLGVVPVSLMLQLKATIH